MLAAATMAPDEPEPTRQPVTVQAKRIAPKKGGVHGYTDNLPAPTKEIRAWARDIGMHVAKGGMLPQDVIEEYRRCHEGIRSA